MSDGLAVWEGERLADDVAAGELFGRLYGQYIGTGIDHPLTAAIAAYVAMAAGAVARSHRGGGQPLPVAD